MSDLKRSAKMNTQLPKDYLSYIEAGGSDSGSTEGDPGYFQLWSFLESRMNKKPNQSLDPTLMSVTDRAIARSAPATSAGHF